MNHERCATHLCVCASFAFARERVEQRRQLRHLAHKRPLLLCVGRCRCCCCCCCLASGQTGRQAGRRAGAVSTHAGAHRRFAHKRLHAQFQELAEKRMPSYRAAMASTISTQGSRTRTSMHADARTQHVCTHAGETCARAYHTLHERAPPSSA